VTAIENQWTAFPKLNGKTHYVRGDLGAWRMYHAQTMDSINTNIKYEVPFVHEQVECLAAI
jgi:hypothetical protein